jgi:hypothetical protein
MLVLVLDGKNPSGEKTGVDCMVYCHDSHSQ